MPDLSVFGNIKNFQDYQRAEDEFQLKKQLAAQKLLQFQKGGNLPAALQIANEYAKARAAGDKQRMNDIALAAKSFDKGVMYGDDGAETMPGYADAVGSIEGTKAAYKQQGEKNVDLRMNPLIGKETKRAEAIGKDLGEEEVDFTNRASRMPQLEDTVVRLSDLGKKATYTYAGQGRDAVIRQAGFPVPDSAVARTEYISMVDNEVLPLLRETFGAQFTQKEGESLKVTLGDPDKSPEEKDAVLRSFIRTKMESLNTSARKLGKETPYGGLNSPQGGEVPLSPAAPQIGEVVDGYLFNGGDPGNPQSWKKVK